MLIATFCALGAAVLHAGWNLSLKQSGDRFVAAALQFLAGGLLFLPVAVYLGLPTGEAALCLGISTLIHLLYVICLVRAYGGGDFSLAYPLARGSGALLAALGGALFLGDLVPPVAVVGMVVAGVGLFSLVQRRSGSRAQVWAVATGCLIASYTLVDTVGARDSNGAAYAMAEALTVGLALTIVAVGIGRTKLLIASARQFWPRHIGAGIASTLAYGLVLVAVGYAPVGYVAVLRESSVVFGSLAGWFLLKERLGLRRAASSMVVLAGIGTMIVAIR